MVAMAADEAYARKLPGLGMMADQVRYTGGGNNLGGAIPLLFPLLLGAGDFPEGQENPYDLINGTRPLLQPKHLCDRTLMLAWLVYHMAAGRTPAAAALYSGNAYSSASNLSEFTNGILRDTLSGKTRWRGDHPRNPLLQAIILTIRLWRNLRTQTPDPGPRCRLSAAAAGGEDQSQGGQRQGGGFGHCGRVYLIGHVDHAARRPLGPPVKTVVQGGVMVVGGVRLFSPAAVFMDWNPSPRETPPSLKPQAAPHP